METPAPLIQTDPSAAGSLEDALAEAIRDGFAWSAARQHADGYWVGRLQTNACMEAEWVLALHVLGLRDHPHVPGLVRALLRGQREDGSWAIYHGAPAGDINATVEAYAALRCSGMAASEPTLTRARGWIAQRGGLRHIRVFTRYWLALIGEWPWEKTPNIPPEVIRFPLWFPFSIYNFASWARATLMPIAVLSARRPVRPLPPESRLDELFPVGRGRFDYSLPKKIKPLTWEHFFMAADKVLHWAQRRRLVPGREAAVARVLEWIIKHQDADGAWGGIQPPWIYSLLALHGEGYPLGHPVVAKGLAALDDPRWSYEEDGARSVQASVSPVWDTVLTLLAMDDCDMREAHREAADRAVEWLLDNEVRYPGDWSHKVRGVAPGGWAFEYANQFYPDVDDTAVALIVLSHLRDEPKWRARGIRQAIDRAVGWVLAMQCSGGGWAAFDRDNDKPILTRIPFSDFGEALDPPSVDVTAHVLEALGALGYDRRHPAIARGLAFLRREQEEDGSWWGRWGVNYVYGTAAVLPALKAVGADMAAGFVGRAADWVTSRQNADGGWGETCGSYMDRALAGRGDSTASQTAWALMALLAAGRPADHGAVEAGLRFLTARQRAGSWDEPEYTGTGFPGYGLGRHIELQTGVAENLGQSIELSRGFMINYNLYRHYFPLMAMGRAQAYLRRLENRAVGEVK
ncbi:MAG: squalene--hopene cyclase [Alphaproteobacteria bacterium]|nr:squalene--hopene cyclase [Alphaproteobacteria bacterium]